MCGKESLVEILNSYYESTSLLKYSESEDEIRFQVPTPIRETQTAVFRSRSAALNELAISHRLSLLVGRAKYGVPEDVGFAIKAVETVVHGIDVVDEYNISLRFKAVTKRHDTITALRSTLITKYGVEARITRLLFNILPPSLANFIRRARQFMDFSDVKITRDQSCLLTLGENHFRYHPSEDDRLSDGRRVDHVPALILIDIALFVNTMAHKGAAYSKIAAEFLNYTDPRLPFDIVQRKDRSAMEFLQSGQLVAVVYDHELSRYSPRTRPGSIAEAC